MVKKDTITIAKLIQRPPRPNLPSVMIFEIVAAQIKSLGHGFDFVIVDPDKARSASAAIAATRTRKFQAVLIPRPFAIC
jgi:hypothetical protein